MLCQVHVALVDNFYLSCQQLRTFTTVRANNHATPNYVELFLDSLDKNTDETSKRKDWIQPATNLTA
eukprot:scaffold925_cov129-Cylindrotheca_fusiformis.AAC.29